MARIDRRFDRQFKRFAKRIKKLTERYSENELRDLLERRDIRRGKMVEDARVQSGKSEIRIPNQRDLVAMTTNEYRENLRIQLHDVIANNGGALAYLKKSRAFLSGVNGCFYRELALYGVGAPLAVGMGTYGLISLGVMVITFGTVLIAPLAVILGAAAVGTGGSFFLRERLGSESANCQMKLRPGASRKSSEEDSRKRSGIFID